MTNLAEFKRSLDRQVQKKVVDFAKAEITKVVLSTYSFIVRQKFADDGLPGSPVLTGRYSNDHNISLNSIDTTTRFDISAGPNNPLPQLPLANAESVMSKFKIGDTVFIANSTFYGPKLEGGESGKAPNGIYKVAAEAIKVKFANLGGSL